MKNLESIKKEISSRIKEAEQIGRFETKAQTLNRLLNCLSKSWYGYNGTLWTYRSYLIKYDRKEYENIIMTIKKYYSGLTRFQDKGRNLDQFNFFHYRTNGIQKNYISFDGRPPISSYK